MSPAMGHQNPFPTLSGRQQDPGLPKKPGDRDTGDHNPPSPACALLCLALGMPTMLVLPAARLPADAAKICMPTGPHSCLPALASPAPLLGSWAVSSSSLMNRAAVTTLALAAALPSSPPRARGPGPFPTGSSLPRSWEPGDAARKFAPPGGLALASCCGHASRQPGAAPRPHVRPALSPPPCTHSCCDLGQHLCSTEEDTEAQLRGSHSWSPGLITEAPPSGPLLSCVHLHVCALSPQVPVLEGCPQEAQAPCQPLHSRLKCLHGAQGPRGAAGHLGVAPAGPLPPRAVCAAGSRASWAAWSQATREAPAHPPAPLPADLSRGLLMSGWMRVGQNDERTGGQVD